MLKVVEKADRALKQPGIKIPIEEVGGQSAAQSSFEKESNPSPEKKPAPSGRADTQGPRAVALEASPTAPEGPSESTGTSPHRNKLDQMPEDVLGAISFPATVGDKCQSMFCTCAYV